MERTSARINIKKAYDDGNLTAGTIGIIVGVVVAVILAVIAIALLVFAKSSGRWCFAEDEEAYRKPQEAKPRSAGGPPSHTQSAQVHRFILLNLFLGRSKRFVHEWPTFLSIV
jgi:hypothetical protein